MNKDSLHETYKELQRVRKHNERGKVITAFFCGMLVGVPIAVVLTLELMS